MVSSVNQICSESYFVNKKIFRTYFLKGMKEISVYFTELLNLSKNIIQRKKGYQLPICN